LIQITVPSLSALLPIVYTTLLQGILCGKFLPGRDNFFARAYTLIVIPAKAGKQAGIAEAKTI